MNVDAFRFLASFVFRGCFSDLKFPVVGVYPFGVEMVHVKCAGLQVAPLGKGAFGAVSVVKWDNDYCALKQISKSLVVKSQLVTHIKAEKRIMSECDCNFLVRMRASFQDSHHLYLLMDFVQVRTHTPFWPPSFFSPLFGFSGPLAC